ncbi:FecR domain-containing protein [Achromobacter insuavis]
MARPSAAGARRAPSTRVFKETRDAWQQLAPAARQLQAAQARRARVARPARRAFLGGAVAACGAWLAFKPPLGLWPAVDELTADVRSGTGEQRRVALAGDASVQLNTQTRINLSRSGPAQQIDLLAGEVELLTSGQLVSLTAGAGRVSATSGCVNVRYTDGQVRVTCLEGSARVALRKDSIELTAAQSGAGRRRRQRAAKGGPRPGHGVATRRAGIQQCAAGAGGRRNQPLSPRSHRAGERPAGGQPGAGALFAGPAGRRRAVDPRRLWRPGHLAAGRHRAAELSAVARIVPNVKYEFFVKRRSR